MSNIHGDVKYSIVIRVAKEHICMIHGHEQWCGDCLREWGRGWLEEGEWEKFGHYNSINDKIQWKNETRKGGIFLPGGT